MFFYINKETHFFFKLSTFVPVVIFIIFFFFLFRLFLKQNSKMTLIIGPIHSL